MPGFYLNFLGQDLSLPGTRHVGWPASKPKGSTCFCSLALGLQVCAAIRALKQTTNKPCVLGIKLRSLRLTRQALFQPSHLPSLPTPSPKLLIKYWILEGCSSVGENILSMF